MSRKLAMNTATWNHSVRSAAAAKSRRTASPPTADSTSRAPADRVTWAACPALAY